MFFKGYITHTIPTKKIKFENLILILQVNYIHMKVV